MFTTFNIRGRAGVAGALLAPGAAAILLAIAACQDELPSAPRQPAPSAAASPEKGGNAATRPGNGAAVWSVKDGNWDFLLGGAQFVLTGPNNFSRVINDDVTPGDQDPTAGNFKTMGLLPGLYQLCETVAPAKYLIQQIPGYSPCTSFNVVVNGTTYMSPFFNVHIPRETWGVVDPVGNFLGNAYFQLHDSTNAVIASGWDNSAFDLDNSLGKFLRETPVPGKYTLCETLAPSGFVPPAQACKLFAASPYITPQNLGNWVNAPTYSMYFNVQDPQGKPLGGTSFVIKRQYYTPQGDINVSDNIAPDRDPTTGKYFVILPAQGWYVVCQHDAPLGFDPPANNCYPIATFPKVGVPANAGTFVDTPWPVAR
jgi:hypothetical protein